MKRLVEHVRRLRCEEGGFTLAEMMVTIMIMTTVMFALYSIFDMSLRVFSFGNDKTEAVENARLGLERMQRELRAAYPYDKLDGNPNDDYLFPSYGPNPSNAITLSNDLDGDRQVDTDTATEQIIYDLSGSELRRNGQPLVEFVVPNGARFDYLRANGTAAASESEVRVVRITLTIQVDRGLADPATQTLSTDVALRNRVE
jgi:prepilin-type N-terminal cleavage/methylation domain-containing protein